jgi:glutathione synthase/RimK-type ligase-like ATP-grasp enzyme
MDKIAIHPKEGSFSDCWIEFCQKNKIPYKLVDCYRSDIVKQVEDCNVIMWHFHHTDPRDVLFAKQLFLSLETSGKKVFPDFKTGWHFDDKVGQKYLLESVGAPLVPSYVFYEKNKALQWADKTEFPKVFKLRRGAGSSHVQLVKDKKTAGKLIHQAFSSGFSQYDAGSNLKERWRKFLSGKNSIIDLIKGILRFGYTTDFDLVAGKERGYAYFQDFISGNDHDIRVIVIHGKAFAIKRVVRPNDFRASGSGMIEYEKQHFDPGTIELSLDLAEKLQAQCLALDFVYENGKPLIVEVSYGYTKEVYEDCTGYWDRELKWHRGRFNPQHWMVEGLLRKEKVTDTRI